MSCNQYADNLQCYTQLTTPMDKLKNWIFLCEYSQWTFGSDVWMVESIWNGDASSLTHMSNIPTWIFRSRTTVNLCNWLHHFMWELRCLRFLFIGLHPALTHVQCSDRKTIMMFHYIINLWICLEKKHDTIWIWQVIWQVKTSVLWTKQYETLTEHHLWYK